MTAILSSRPVREASALARTTPGMLTALALALVAAGLLAGMFTGLAVQRRAAAIDDLATTSGPLTAAAQEIYRSLSDADATATGAFLTGGAEPAATRQRYFADIAQAGNALAIAIAARDPADVTAPGSSLATLSQELPVYTGLVETARADNRQGLPLGAAYQREASNLMRAQLLPAAQKLYQGETAALSADQDDASGVPWVEILLAVVVLAVLVLAQLFLRRRTNRVFNAGLLAATAAAFVSLVWVVVAASTASAYVSDSRDEGSAQADVLAQAGVATLTARADETLTLVARGGDSSYQDDYLNQSKRLGDLLDRARGMATADDVRALIDKAKAENARWAQQHTAIRAADDSGDYVQAVAIATDPNQSAGVFDRLDRDLRGATDDARASFGDEVSGASSALSGTLAGVTVLAVIVAAASAAGIWRRLRDYR